MRRITMEGHFATPAFLEGPGRDLKTRAQHDLSPRQGRTFIKLNCAAIPTGLLESELFGHEKGAFTGVARGLSFGAVKA